DVDEPLLDDLLNNLTEFAQAAIADFAGVGLRRTPWGADGQGHVGVLGVGEDEVLADARVGVDAGQLHVERLLHHWFHPEPFSDPPQKRRGRVPTPRRFCEASLTEAASSAPSISARPSAGWRARCP